MGRLGRSGSADASGTRMPGATSRWNRGKDLSWEPLRIERVAEVAYDHLQGDRFRHATTFQRWRFDKAPADVATTSWKRPPRLSYSASSRPKQARNASPLARSTSTLAAPQMGHVLQGGMNG